MSEKVIEIPIDATATFRARPNRFLGIVDINKPAEHRLKNVEVHIHDPGRLKELLYDGNKVLLRKAITENRRTGWDLIAAKFNDKWVLVNSSVHRAISYWYISTHGVTPFKNFKEIRPEAIFGASRLDYQVVTRSGKKIWIEVKGCTLTKSGVALFPDAPTERGRKHLNELITIKKEGMDSVIMILIFRDDSGCFMPNAETDPEFSKLFFSAKKIGVKILPLLFKFENGMIFYMGRIPVCKK